MMPLPDILGDVCGIAATVGSFLICRMIYQRLGQPLLHPGLWSTMVLVMLVGITHHPLSAYRQETAPLVWLLGLAVVAMAVPIWERRPHRWRSALPTERGFVSTWLWSA
jgi:putative effector of murein hydrolase